MSQSLHTSKLHVAFSLAQEQCANSFIEWVSLVEQRLTSHKSPSAIQSIGCSGVKHTTTRLQSSGGAFSLVINWAYPSGNLINWSGFVSCQENSSFWLIVPSGQFGRRRIMVWGCSSGAGLGPLTPVKGTLNNSAYQDILKNSRLSTLLEQFGTAFSSSNITCASVHKAKSFKT